jgi:hypothetical protein
MKLPQLGQIYCRGLPQLPQNLSKGTRGHWHSAHFDWDAPSTPSCALQKRHWVLSEVFSFQQLGHKKFFCIFNLNGSHILGLFRCTGNLR